jgi:hypothetical protein
LATISNSDAAAARIGLALLLLTVFFGANDATARAADFEKSTNRWR